VNQKSSSQVSCIRVKIRSGGPHCSLRFRHVKPEQVRNRLCDLFLDRKHVLEFAAERLRP
jgi:hypothetical protein